MLKRVFMGEVTHTTKVTSQGGTSWIVAVLVNGEVNQQCLVKSKKDIHKEIHGMLRMEDKCGNRSKMASRARFRYWEKIEE